MKVTRRWKAARQAMEDDHDWIIKYIRPGERKRLQHVRWFIAAKRFVKHPKKRLPPL